jgi:hypothetical protein
VVEDVLLHGTRGRDVCAHFGAHLVLGVFDLLK